MSTNLLRRYSPSPLAWGSGRVDGGDALTEEPDHHEVERPEVGEPVAIDLEAVGLRQERAEPLGREERSSHAQPSGERAHNPTLRVAPLVPRSRADDGAEGAAGGSRPVRRPAHRPTARLGRSRPAGGLGASWLARWGTSTRRPSPWTTAGTTSSAGTRAGQKMP